MKVTNNQIVNANMTLQRLAPSIGDTVVRFRIAQALKAFVPAVESWEEVRKSIIDECGEKDESGQPKTNDGFVVWKEGKTDEAIEELNKLGSIEVDISVTPIKLSRFAESLQEAPDYAAIQSIDWLIDDDIE